MPVSDLESLRTRARDARERPFTGKPATQTVFGEGPRDARIALVGEQPGDEEDWSGRPFVGLAGRLLQRALNELGIQRDALYLTNAVKHFRFERRGKHRLHKAPQPGHARACNGWRRKWTCSNPRSSCASARPLRTACSAAISD